MNVMGLQMAKLGNSAVIRKFSEIIKLLKIIYPLRIWERKFTRTKHDIIPTYPKPSGFLAGGISKPYYGGFAVFSR